MKTRDDFYLCSNAVIRFEACYLGNECLILDISCVLLKIDRQFQFDFQCLHKGKYTPIVNINQVFEKTFGLNILSKSTPVNCNSRSIIPQMYESDVFYHTFVFSMHKYKENWKNPFMVFETCIHEHIRPWKNLFL